MLIFCINNSVGDKRYSITVGKAYTVLSIDVFFRSDNSILIRIIDDEELVSYIPAHLFEFKSLIIPEGWRVDMKSSSISVLPSKLSKSCYVTKSSFWEDFYNSVPSAYNQLKIVLRKLNVKAPSYLGLHNE